MLTLEPSRLTERLEYEVLGDKIEKSQLTLHWGTLTTSEGEGVRKNGRTVGGVDFGISGIQHCTLWEMIMANWKSWGRSMLAISAGERSQGVHPSMYLHEVI